MIIFPNAKINIGLNITGKRADGFHDIETVFYPLHELSDPLEYNINSDSDKSYIFTSSGIDMNSSPEDNLCIKAYALLKKEYILPSLKIHLHKVIPIGAGLGGGSADGAFLLKSLNNYFKLNISQDKLEEYALQLGSDCAFFIRNKPAYATGKGELLTTIDLSLKNLKLILVYPGIHISSKEAYSSVTPKKPQQLLSELVKLPLNDWKGKINNDFEISIFKKYPQIKNIKTKLYDMGAIYAAMSGSGSSVYGIFKPEILIKTTSFFKNCYIKEMYLT